MRQQAVADLVRNQQRNGGVAQQRPGHAAKYHLRRSRMAVGADNDEVGGVASGIGQNDIGDGLAARLHRFDDDPGAVTCQVVRHIGTGLLAVSRIFLRIDHQDGNGLGADEKRKRIRDRAPRLAAGIPGDDDALGPASGPVLRHDEEGDAGGEQKLFGRPLAGQSTGPRTPDDHQIGMQGIQPGAVVDGALVEKAELEADAFACAARREIPPRGFYRGGLDRAGIGDDLPNSLLPANERFAGLPETGGTAKIPIRWAPWRSAILTA